MVSCMVSRGFVFVYVKLPYGFLYGFVCAEVCFRVCFVYVFEWFRVWFRVVSCMVSLCLRDISDVAADIAWLGFGGAVVLFRRRIVY